MKNINPLPLRPKINVSFMDSWLQRHDKLSSAVLWSTCELHVSDAQWFIGKVWKVAQGTITVSMRVEKTELWI